MSPYGSVISTASGCRQKTSAACVNRTCLKPCRDSDRRCAISARLKFPRSLKLNNSEVRNMYKITVGIEWHVQLKTQTKLFAAVGNDAREAPPNTLVSHICFAL